MRRFATGLFVFCAFLLFFGLDRVRAQGERKVEIVPQIAHSSTVTAVAFSPDGRQILSGDEGGAVKLWHTATNLLLRTFEGHSDRVWSIAFSPDGLRVLAGGGDSTLRLWDAASGAPLLTFNGHSGTVRSVAFSPDGLRAASGSDDKAVKIWNAITGALLHTFAVHSASIFSVAFSPDGKNLISSSEDKTLKLWDTNSGQILRTFTGHESSVGSAAFSPDGKRVASGSWDNTLRLWDAWTGDPLAVLVGHSGAVRSVVFSNDGRFLLSGSDDKSVKLWDAGSGRLLQTFEGDAVKRLDEDSRRRLKTAEDFRGSFNSVAFSPDAQQVIFTNWLSGLELWDAKSGQLLRHLGGNYGGPVHSALFSPDGQQILSGHWDHTLKLWDRRSGRLLRTLEGHLGRVYAVSFSPDGRQLLSGSKDGTAKLWDSGSGQLIRTLDKQRSWIRSVAFSPDGKRVLTGDGDNEFRLWSIENGKLLHSIKASQLSASAVFSPDGRFILTSDDKDENAISAWDTATGRLSRKFGFENPYGLIRIAALAFSPDGTRVLAGGYVRWRNPSWLMLWDAESGQLIKQFDEHPGGVHQVAFSSDGQKILTGNSDKTLKLWDASSGRLLSTLTGHRGEISAVAFAPNDRQALSTDVDGTLRIWDCTTGKPVATMLASPEGDWLTITPEGFFAAGGQETAKYLAVASGFDVTTLGQVHQSLFSPDLVREALTGDIDGELREASGKINLDKVVDSGPAPSIQISQHSDQSESDVILLQVRITDLGKGVGRIEWRINGITAAVVQKPKGTGPEYTLTQQLALDPGDNLIEIVAYNANNLLASLPARTTIKYSGQTDQTKPDLHILAIGINAYTDRGWKGHPDSAFAELSLAKKDAEGFAADMASAAAGQYGQVKVVTALDAEATKDNLGKLIDRIARTIRPRDTFLLFAAAHGYSVDGRYYLIPQDYDGGTNPVALAKGGVDQGMLQDWLANRIKARKAVVFLDTCESGALIASHSRSRTDTTSEAAIGRLHEATGRPVLTASALRQFAFEDSENKLGVRHGLFTWALLQALRHGDTNDNKLIELSELVAYVQDQVPKLAAQLGGVGTTKSATGGATAISDIKQQARFGSRGEDFVLARRLSQ